MLCFLSGIINANAISKRQLPRNELEVIPQGPHHMPVGRNLFFTCKAQVQNPELVRDLRWLGPEGERIPEDDR